MSRFEFNHQSLIFVTCGTCGVHHAIPAAIYDNAVEEGGYWHCPNGHSRGFREGRKEREAVRRERDRLLQQRAQLQDEVTAANKRADKFQRQMKGLQHRVSKGVCPCCQRSFVKLQMHMKTKHPEYGQLVAVTGGKS
jgi:hypothetical protein